MDDDIRTRLEGEFESIEVREPIHQVPPHAVYEVAVDGRRVIMKLDTGPTGGAAVEGRVMRFVDRRTDVPVPEILHCVDDHYVAAWDPAAPDPSGDARADATWARAAGRGLATLHTGTAPHVDSFGAFVPQGDGVGVSGHATWHRAALEYLRERRHILARYGHDDVADTVIGFLEERPDAFAGVRGPVCCHGWATPEHVTVADGAVQCLVDFEHAIAAPAEFDYWRTVIPAFRSRESEQPRRAFRDGYESVRPLPDGLDDREPYFRLLNLVYFFESLYVQDQHRRDERECRASRMRNRVFETIADLDPDRSAVPG